MAEIFCSQCFKLTRRIEALEDGSFVTAKAKPQDVDAVILLPSDFEHQIE